MILDTCGNCDFYELDGGSISIQRRQLWVKGFWGEVAGDPVLFANLAEGGDFDTADVYANRASRVETAPRRGIDRTGNVSR